MEAITAEEFKKRLVAISTTHGSSGLPRKRRDRHILLKSVVLSMDITAEYSEHQINLMLQSWLRDVGPTPGVDHVELRRHLIDQEYLGRNRDGSRYWVAVSSRWQMEFDDAINGIDVPLLMKQAQLDVQEKKRQFLSNNATQSG
jgi:hypothetical protein